MARDDISLPTVTTVYSDKTSMRPMKEARKSILSYLNLPNKGFIDLSPAVSQNFMLHSNMRQQQFQQLKQLQRQSAESYQFKAYIEGMGEIPPSVGVVIQDLDQKIADHDCLFHQSRQKWKDGYFDSLPYYNLRKYMTGRFDEDGKWNSFREFCLVVHMY